MGQDAANGPLPDCSAQLSDAKPRAAHSGRSWKRLIRPLTTLLLTMVVSVSVFLISDRVAAFGRYGYPGVFVLSLLSSATIVLPAPSLAIVSVMGAVLNPVGIGLAAGAGEALGELTGYAAGYSGRAIVADQVRYQRMVTWTRRYGLWVILVLSIVPNPLFDLAGIAAGALRVPVWHFLLVCWVGKTVKTTVFAFAGQSLLHVLPFFGS
ncbi:MAG: YqaA family protein [Anaerolineae bacterium]